MESTEIEISIEKRPRTFGQKFGGKGGVDY